MRTRRSFVRASLLLAACCVPAALPLIVRAQPSTPRPIVLTPLGKTTFAAVGGVRELPAGVLVSDPESDVIDIISGDGAVKALTRPGAIAAPGGLQPWRDDLTLAFSRQNNAFVLVGPDGALTDAPASLAAPDGPLRIATASDVYAGGSDGSLYWAESARGESSALYRRDPGGVLHTIATLKNPPTTTVREGAIGYTMSTLFAPLDDWALAPNGDVVIARGEPYRIDRLTAAGAMQQGPPHTYDPVPVTSGDRDEYARNQRRPRSGGLNINGLGISTTPPSPTFADKKSAFGRNATVAAPDGSVWVRRLGPANADRTLFDVFTAAGQFREQVALPGTATIMAFGKSLAYVRTVDGETRARVQTFRWP